MGSDTSRRQDSQSADQQRTTHKENQKGGTRGQGHPKVEPIEENSDCCCHCRYQPTPSWLRILEAIGIISAIAYAIITWCLWRDSHNNFIADERAWLEIHATPMLASDIQVNAPIYSHVVIRNSGKTLARKVWFEFQVEILRNAEATIFNYETKHVMSSQNIIVPGEVLPPVKVEMGEISDPNRLTDTQAKDLLEGRAYMVLYGRGIYWDDFENQHWFHYCVYNNYFTGFMVQKVANCSRYTDVGNGSLPEGSPHPKS